MLIPVSDEAMATPDASSNLDQPPPSFLKRIASLTAVTGEHYAGGGGTATDNRVPTANVRYYVELEGFKCETFHVTTRDGFVLQLERISADPAIDIKTPQSKRKPVILMHGLFQSAGVWVTSQRRGSFAFYLVENGYDVWLANNRACCAEMVVKQHAFLDEKKDAKFWDWCLDDLAIYDVPAVVDGVRRFTGWNKVAYVGHSQGNAQMFLALQFDPKLNEKLSVFVALAPAVYTGPLLNAFPVNNLISLKYTTHQLIFGSCQFLPIINIVQKIVPAHLMMTLSYHMFHFLFDWTDTNWDTLNKPHFFQFTPRPQSSKNLHHWAQIGQRGFIQPFMSQTFEPLAATTAEFDVSCLKCPVALYYGTKDAIVDARRLHWQCWEGSQRKLMKQGGNGPVVDLLAVEEVEGYEHMDCLWALDAEEKVWRRVLKVLQ